MNATANGEVQAALSSPPARRSFLARHWQKLAALVIWLVLAAGIAWYVRSSEDGVGGALLNLLYLIQGSVWGPVIYILVYALRPLTFFSAVLLTVSGGFIFGPVWGVIYTIIGANASAMVAYVIGRYLGQGLINLDDSDGTLQRYARRMRANSFETVLIMRFIFLPYDLVSYLAGFLRINWKAFLLATALGSILGTLSFVLLGASATLEDMERLITTGEIPSLNPGVLIGSVVVFAASLVLSRYFRKREETSAPGLTTEAPARD